MFFFLPYFPPVPVIIVEDTSNDTIKCEVVEVEQPRFKNNRFSEKADTSTEIVCKEQ